MKSASEVAPESEPSRVVRLYFLVYRALEGFARLATVVNSGFWLGFLNREQLHGIGHVNYAKAHYYYTDEYNKRGLWDWERAALESHFEGRKRLLLAAAGGGREVIALRKLGFEVCGFESDRGLLDFANDLLRREGMEPDLIWAPWDHCPELSETYDGAIVGWGAYMLIRGSKRRVEFLREVRARVEEGAPILVSFNTAGDDSRFFRGIAKVGNVVARILRRERVEVGDSLTPNYEHFFTREQIESEMGEAGFALKSFHRYGFGHGVGRAV